MFALQHHDQTHYTQAWLGDRLDVDAMLRDLAEEPRAHHADCLLQLLRERESHLEFKVQDLRFRRSMAPRVARRSRPRDRVTGATS